MSLQDVIFLSKYWKLENLVFKKQGERRSRPEVFLKNKGVLKNFAKLKENSMCCSLFLIEIQTYGQEASDKAVLFGLVDFFLSTIIQKLYFVNKFYKHENFMPRG